MRFNQRYVDEKVLRIDHDHGQYRRNSLIAAYHRSVLKKAVALAGLRPGMSVLDYGCGKQMLKSLLPAGVHYTGYDLVEDFSDVSDPSAQQYDTIFAIQVLMYPNEEGLREVTALFAAITKKLIVMVPSQTQLKRYLLDPLLGLKKDADETFRSKPQHIYQTLSGKFERESLTNYLGVAAISRWRRKENLPT